MLGAGKKLRESMTTQRKTATAARATTTTRATKTAPKTKAQPSPTLITVSEPVISAPELKKRDLINLVVERSGIKKKDAKPAVEAALAVLGEALAEGRELNMRPLGKAKVTRMENKSNGQLIVCRIRQPHETQGTGDQKETLAEDQD